MNVRDVEAFLAVVETGSIVAAASRLNLTQPGVTRRVQALEEALGTALLDRQSKPLKPSKAGREAYEFGRRVVASVADLKARVAPVGDAEGTFRIGIAHFLSEVALAAPLDHLRTAFPRLKPRVTSDWSPRLVEQVRSGQLDAAALSLSHTARPPADLPSLLLATEAIRIVAARDAPLPALATLRDLAGYAWIMNPDGCSVRCALDEMFTAAGMPFEVSAEALSYHLRLSLVARGMGLGLVTDAVLAASPMRDQLQVVSVAGFTPRVEAWLVHRPRLDRLAPAVQRFADELKAAILTLPLHGRTIDAKDLLERQTTLV